jgi:hypothetical protein
MFFHSKNLKSENNNPWFKPWFNILLHTQSIVCATVDSQCLEYLGYITLLFLTTTIVDFRFHISLVLLPSQITTSEHTLITSVKVFFAQKWTRSQCSQKHFKVAFEFWYPTILWNVFLTFNPWQNTVVIR